jgi:hypothetical protein
MLKKTKVNQKKKGDEVIKLAVKAGGEESPPPIRK